MRFPGFIGPSYQLNSVNVDCQRCINLYPELTESGRGKEQEVASLVGTPGKRLLATLSTGPVRGLYTSSNGRLFAVSHDKLYELDSDFSSTLRGTLNSSVGQVSISDDGYYLVVVDGGDGYQLTLADNTFAQIVDPLFLGGDQVVCIDGYFIFNKPDSSGFFISNNYTERVALGNLALGFDGQEVALDGDPDTNNGLLANGGNLWMFNERTTEAYYDSGDTFPFARIQGAFIEQGCAARFSVAKINNSIIWLGKNPAGGGVVYSANGFQPQRISTHAVEQAINTYGDISDSVAFTYSQNGHHFYVLNFANADTTWVFDASTSMWHERAYTNQGSFERDRANCHAYAFSTHIVGDYEDGRIYELSMSTYTDDGDEIRRQRITPHISGSGKRMFYNSLELDIESGVGLDGVGQGTDPQAVLDFSNDGGHTWSNEKWASMGMLGQTKLRALWRRLGSARDRVFRVTISDPVKVVIVGANIEAEGGIS